MRYASVIIVVSKQTTAVFEVGSRKVKAKCKVSDSNGVKRSKSTKPTNDLNDINDPNELQKAD